MAFGLPVVAAGCGEGTINLDDFSYRPQIVINGFLLAGHPVTDIRIQRNFPVSGDIDKSDQYLTDAAVTLTHVDLGLSYPLLNNGDDEINYFFYPGALRVGYGQTYRLDVTAVIDGDTLHAVSTTTVPEAGFGILPDSSSLGAMYYLERDSVTRDLRYFSVAFDRSPGTQFYAISMKARYARPSTFIYSPENPFVGPEVDSVDVLENLGSLRTTTQWIQDAPIEPGVSRSNIFWFFLHFYGEYDLFVYAGDQNFKDFIQTYDQVQDIDGNFYEPVFHIDGDGIGVFASAVVDTASFTILKRP
jgi:hypothetical protein